MKIFDSNIIANMNLFIYISFEMCKEYFQWNGVFSKIEM